MRNFNAMPYQPDRLTTPDFSDTVHNQNMTETSQVVQTYFDCGWPGPSRFVFIDNVFAGWWPYVTCDRALALPQ